MVTGGAGFIGSALVLHLLSLGARVLNIDRLTYAGNLDNLQEATDNPRYSFQQLDICDTQAMQRIMTEFRPDGLFHLAAESHVDRSIDLPLEFVRTNVYGTASLLSAAQGYCSSNPVFRFIHISTDEVYGDLALEDPPFTPESPYRPSSPYSASKAGADHLVRAWVRTYGFPAIISHSSNNYGPRQHPEKLIPRIITRALQQKTLPIYGSGENIRDWLHVEDHVRALVAILLQGKIGADYLVGAGNEISNIQLVLRICDRLDEMRPCASGESYRRLIRMVSDRPGHDLRYAIAPERLLQDTHWRPEISFADGLDNTIRWYLEH